MATSPSKLHRLHRFFRHEEDDNDDCYWNVAAGGLEKRQRLYRILYKSSTVDICEEVTIDVKCPELLKDYFILLLKTAAREDIDPKFAQACSDLLSEDPWLGMFSLVPTKIHPVTDIENAVSF